MIDFSLIGFGWNVRYGCAAAGRCRRSREQRFCSRLGTQDSRLFIFLTRLQLGELVFERGDDFLIGNDRGHSLQEFGAVGEEAQNERAGRGHIAVAAGDQLGGSAQEAAAVDGQEGDDAGEDEEKKQLEPLRPDAFLDLVPNEVADGVGNAHG